MDFELTEDQSLLLSAVREFAEDVVRPRAARIDQTGEFPRDVFAEAGKLGLAGVAVSAEHGGSGMDTVSYSIVIEEISRISASLAIMIAVHNSVGLIPVFRFANDDQKRRFLPRLVSKDMSAFSLSEPGAGSDVGALEAIAVRNGDHYVINGTKNWVTNGHQAGIYLIFARTDKAAGHRGISAFVVERGTPGLVLGKPEDKMGLRGSDTVGLSLENLRVPLDNRLGAEGEGFKIALSALDAGRIGVAAQALGVMRAAFEEAVRYAQQRHAFGGPLAKIQAIQFKLAEMERRIQASRLLIRRAAWLRDSEKPFGREAAMAKLYATEAATWVTHQAIQIHGGYGYVTEYPVERFMREAKGLQIVEGTNQIQRHIIGRKLVGLPT